MFSFGWLDKRLILYLESSDSQTSVHIRIIWDDLLKHRLPGPPPELFFFFFFLIIIYLFMSVLVFVSVRGLSLVAASGGHSSSRCAGLSLSWPFFLRSTGSRYAGSAIVAHGPSCSAVCGIFPDQGSNPCPLHWQADSQPLRHQGSPPPEILIGRCGMGPEN